MDLTEARTRKLADDRCGMNRQAAVLLRALAMEEMDVPAGLFIDTKPYCNCREMGFVVSLMTAGDPVNIAFYEHRNSDELCALKWTGRTAINGGVTPDDIPPEVFPTKRAVTKSWPYMSINEAIEYVREVVREESEKYIGQETLRKRRESRAS